MSAYFSFLVCYHPGHTDIFISGTPLGIIENGKFKLHEKLTPAGNRVPVSMHDFTALTTGPCPFKTMDDLKTHLLATVAVLSFEPCPGS